jgi:hypothetical protein
MNVDHGLGALEAEPSQASGPSHLHGVAHEQPGEAGAAQVLAGVHRLQLGVAVAEVGQGADGQQLAAATH